MANPCVIIGLGQIGMGYDFDITVKSVILTHARAISVHPAFFLVGAVDVSPLKRARFEQRYGVPAFDQVEVALRQLQPDVVVIATSTQSHASVLAEVIKVCQPKLVLCEKPLAYELDDARSMVEMCEKAGIALFVNYIRRADPGVVEIKRRFNHGEISAPVKVNAWYSKGIFNNGSHILNLLEMWLGDISDATPINSGRLWDNHDPELDVEIQFELGSAIFRSAWEECYSHNCIELLSRSGRLRYDKGGEVIEWQGVHESPNFGGDNVLTDQKEFIANGMGMYQWHVCDQVFKQLAGMVTSLCTGRQALATLEVIDSIIRKRSR